jgi:hypothetical protein
VTMVAWCTSRSIRAAAGDVDQVNNAIAYLQQGLRTSLGSSSGRAVNITA